MNVTISATLTIVFPTPEKGVTMKPIASSTTLSPPARYTGRSCRRIAGVARRQRPTRSQNAPANRMTAATVESAVVATCAA